MTEQVQDETEAMELEQGDLFLCDVANWPVKDDLASMDVPIFSLSKSGDTRVRKYTRGNKTVTIIPSTLGAATVFDKDLLLYVASQIIAARNEGKPISRKVRVESYDYLTGTDRGDSGSSFDNVIGVLRRLRGTTIETNIETGGVRPTEGFGLIEDYKVLSSKKRLAKKKYPKTGKAAQVEVEQVHSFELTVSEWLMNGLLNFEVLTLDRGYFRLDKPIERRLYELARRHCGDQAIWKINIDLLAEKIGIARERFKFRSDLREIIERDPLPQYRIALDSNKNPDDVVFYTREQSKITRHLVTQGLLEWFQGLERSKPLA